MSLKISEHFFSIQGEGKTTGVPAYFIRLTDCNLSCGSTQKLLNQIRKGILNVDPNTNWHGDLHLENKASWTCDSIPVWVKGQEVEYQEIINNWLKKGLYPDIKNGIIHIIWTGGEPTLPYHQKSIVEFTKYWLLEIEKNLGLSYFYEIETNGTIYIERELFDLLKQINCSPKLSNSGMPKNKRIVPEAIDRIMQHNNYQFKFVVDTENDIKEVFKDFIEPFSIPIKNVCMMPALDDQSKFHERTNFICEMAKKYKFIAAQRLHISSWGAVTGV